MQYNDYKHIIPIQVRFSDIDRLNHVNNACYLNFFELGRVSYFSQVLKEHVNWREKGFVLARTEINHIKSVLLNDEIYCCTKIVSFGNKSLIVHNAVVKIEEGNIIDCANGLGVLVAMDYVNNVSIEIPADWKSLMESFEKSGA